MDNEFEIWHKKRFTAKDERAYIHRMAGWKAALVWVLKIKKDTRYNTRVTIEQELRKTNPPEATVL